MKILKAFGLAIAIVVLRVLAHEVWSSLNHAFVMFFQFIGGAFEHGQASVHGAFAILPIQCSFRREAVEPDFYPA